MFCSFHFAAEVEDLAPSVTRQRTGHDAVAHGLRQASHGDRVGDQSCRRRGSDAFDRAVDRCVGVGTCRSYPDGVRSFHVNRHAAGDAVATATTVQRAQYDASPSDFLRELRQCREHTVLGVRSSLLIVSSPTTSMRMFAPPPADSQPVLAPNWTGTGESLPGGEQRASHS